ncbi:zinc-dependent alcohol dehydrogenase [Halobellus marinus]|uniref:zinc-dependent alcohol dehydrogenase n=1 Tax=Halobellus TaxID=1073986 RepID=UPI0028A94EED|nr:zinc-binding dehydrogenase [Halobellus sp. DFY28]
MKTTAIVMDEPGTIEQREIELPDPGPDDVLLRVELSGICGTDVHMYNGGMDLEFPVIPGHEFAGEIEHVGENVEEDSKGAEIEEGDNLAVVPAMPGGSDDWYARNMPGRPRLSKNPDRFGFDNVGKQYTGGMSKYNVLPSKAAYYKLPDDMDGELGALVEPLSVGMHAFERSMQPGLPHMREGFGVGRSVAVQGAGPIGLFAICSAKAAGAGQIIAIDAMEERLDLAEQFGATDVVDLTEVGDELVPTVKGLTNGNVGPDVVIEAAGVPQAVEQGLELPHDGGTYVEAGHFAYNGESEINPTRIVQKELNIYGSLAYPPTQFESAIELMDQLKDEVPFRKLFNFKTALDDAEEAYKAQESGEAYRATIHPHGI